MEPAAMRIVFAILYLWWAFWLMPVFQGVLVDTGRAADHPLVMVFAIGWPVTLPPALLHIDMRQGFEQIKSGEVKPR